MRVFVTGGSGFLGQRLLARLQRDGHEVSALSRSPRSDEMIRRWGATVVAGSLEDVAAWEGALAGHDVVVHAAAPVDVWGTWEGMYQAITQATIDVYAACGRQQVRRFIFISSESVLQDRRSLLDVDETFPYPDEPNSYYGKAKKLAEVALLQRPTATACVILRPTFIWGAGAPQLETIAQKVRDRQFVWVDRGQVIIEMVHVENVVAAICLALTVGEGGQVYFVTDDRAMPAQVFLTALLRGQGVTFPTASIPSVVARPLAAVVEWLWRAMRRSSVPPLSRFQLDFIALPRRYRIDKIKRDLGYRPVYSLDQGLQEMSGVGVTRP